MSAAKNLIEGMLGMVDHMNATHWKIGVIQASLSGEFEEDELRDFFDKLDRARWRLQVLQNCIRRSVEMKIDLRQFPVDQSVMGSAVPEPSSAVPRDHRSHGD